LGQVTTPPKETCLVAWENIPLIGLSGFLLPSVSEMAFGQKSLNGFGWLALGDAVLLYFRGQGGYPTHTQTDDVHNEICREKAAPKVQHAPDETK
jgi:hypothetical protein